MGNDNTVTEENLVERVAQTIIAALRDNMRQEHIEAARAVVALLGPAPLEWEAEKVGGWSSDCDTYFINPDFCVWEHGNFIGKEVSFDDAAARANRYFRAAWWAQTVAVREG